MYINAAIEAADRLYPNEYDIREKYLWCDELSAMLTQEYAKRYERIRLEADADGTYLLPEGIEYEMVDRVFDGRKMIEKQDFRSFGVIYLSAPRGRIALPDRHTTKGYIDVVYIKQHEPIRVIQLKDKRVRFNKSSFEISDTCLFKVGDILVFKMGDIEIDNVAVMEIEQTNAAGTSIIPTYTISVNDDAFADFLSSIGHSVGGTPADADIMRFVTDKTICPAPYDAMYIDYINAKVCFYQHDYESYNQHMTVFNSRLYAYQMWLKERDPMGDDGKLKNWW